MKILFCIFLLFYFCYCVENSDGSENTSRGKVNDGGNLDNDQLENKDQSQDSIIRPCSLQDLKCIRGYFAYNSQCLVTEGPAPDPYKLHFLLIPLPQANLTYTLVNPQIKGLNKWKIEEFYINKATDKLVLEVVFDKIVVTCPDARLKYNRKGKEPLEVSDFSIVEYDDLSFTLTIPNIRNLQVSKGNLFTYINDVAPKFTLGPATYSSEDPGFKLAITDMLARIDISLREAFVSQGPVFFYAFFKSYICDFGY